MKNRNEAIDLMRDVYMSREQREAYEYLIALPKDAGEPVAIHQWRARRGEHEPWNDASKEQAYLRVDEHYEAREFSKLVKFVFLYSMRKPLAINTYTYI